MVKLNGNGAVTHVIASGLGKWISFLTDGGWSLRLLRGDPM